MPTDTPQYTEKPGKFIEITYLGKGVDSMWVFEQDGDSFYYEKEPTTLCIARRANRELFRFILMPGMCVHILDTTFKVVAPKYVPPTAPDAPQTTDGTEVASPS